MVWFDFARLGAACSVLISPTLTIALVACAHGNVSFVSPDGAVRTCASTGLGVVGTMTATDFQSRCVDSLKGAGFIPVEEVGSIGLVASANESSLRIEKVLAGSPAEIAGIKAGDFIVAVNDHPVKNWQEARRLIFGRVNAPVTLTYRSGDSAKTASVTRYPFVSMPNGM